MPKRLWMAIGLFILAAGAMEAGADELFMGNLADGVRQARYWQHAGDVAWNRGELEIAYTFYKKVADIFPETPHGRYAQLRMRMVEERLEQPQESPAEESWDTWKREVYEMFVWP